MHYDGSSYFNIEFRIYSVVILLSLFLFIMMAVTEKITVHFSRQEFFEYRTFKRTNWL